MKKLSQKKRIAELKKFYPALPDNLTVGGSLYLEGTGITALPDNLTVGGYLDLEGTGITALPDNLTVGGYLDLRGTGITALPDNLTVGGSLYLEGTGITALPDNLTVGGSLDLEGTGITDKEVNKPNTLLQWEGGKYILVDGIFTEVTNKYGKLYHIKKIGSKQETYLYGYGKMFAHGETIEKAKEDYNFKKISEKLKHQLIKENTVINIRYYRLITGACEMGVRDWMQRNNIASESIKAKELLPLLRKTNAYGLERFEKLIKF